MPHEPDATFFPVRDLQRMPASEKGFAATDNSGKRRQTKGRRNKPRQLPEVVVKSCSGFQERTKSWIFTAKNKMRELANATDLTAQLQEAGAKLP